MKPNIIFISVDQMHHKAISAYSNPYVNTPNLDRMVKEGTSFMKMHVIMPMCCPSRASWMTGRTSKEHGIVLNGCPVNPEFIDIAQWFRQNNSGYETVYTGKWHVTNRHPENSFDKILIHEGTPVGEQLDAAVARSTLAYLQNKKDDKPFFLCAGFLNPHDCCYTAGALGAVGKFALRDDMEPELPPIPANFADPKPPYIQRTEGWGLRGWRYYIYSYYRMVEMVDAQIGLIYNAVQNSRFADNTIIIFSSDHGDGLGFHGNLGKGTLADEAWRVPVIVCGKGIPKNVQDEDHLASSLDIPATICDYAGVPNLPESNLSRSWRPVLEGKNPEWHEYIVGETPHPYRGLSFRDNQNMKTIFYKDDPTDVFDMENDPGETVSISNTPEGKAVIERHKKYVIDYMSKITLSPIPDWGPLRPDENKQHWYDYIEWYADLKKELTS